MLLELTTFSALLSSSGFNALSVVSLVFYVRTLAWYSL